MIPRAIHQFSISCSSGDGVTSGMLLIQRLLRAAGIDSEIYCEGVPVEMASQVWRREDYVDHPDHILLVHHCIGNAFEDWLKSLESRCFMVFHNITPADFFAPDDPIQPMLAHGWQQVEQWQSWIEGTIADSRKNLELLLEYGYSLDSCADIPLLVDLDKFERAPQSCQVATKESARGEFSLVFVGRLMPHKNQASLISMLAHLRLMTSQDVHLTLVGGDEDKTYTEGLCRQIDEAGLSECVHLTGKVSDSELTREYRSADLYVSLSRHEGFGMPLLEAMAQGLPVLAYSSADSNVEHTLGDAGFLLASDDVEQCAAVVAELMNAPRLRAAISERARVHLSNFSPQVLFNRLQDFFLRFDVQLGDTLFPAAATTEPRFRIEGPFDSSYSLALVNRELARALNRRHPGQVALHSTEGLGDFLPDGDFLSRDSDCRAMHALSQKTDTASYCLRLLYPPRVTEMRGHDNGMGCYGWEESVFPSEYVRSFNQRLQFITSMSSYVTHTLIDNGVRSPIARVGIGADHILEVSPATEGLPDCKEGMRLLHVSSCFPRKGVDCLLDAYGRAFNSTDPVTLILKTFPNPHHDIEAQLEDWRSGLTNAPAVLLINTDLSDASVRALYLAADVLVAPSRGEGFGLPMAEAMLHDCPVITTGFGGQSDFCRPDTAWLIDYHFARAESHMGQAASIWVDPDTEHLESLLKEFYDHYVRADLDKFTELRVRAARKLVAEQYSWDAVAERLDNFLQKGSAELLDPQLKLGVITSWNSKCGIATYSRLLLEPALSDCLVLANDDAELTGDDQQNVVRCWTAGQDDSLQRLEGEILAARLDQVLIQFNFSFFSLTALRGLLSCLAEHKIQVFITFHSTADVYWGDELKTLRDLCPELKAVERVFVHGVEDMNRLKSFGLIDNVTLFPHGVALPEKLPAPREVAPEELRLRLEQSTVIASYGFLLPHKGIRQLIEAFSEQLKVNTGLHLLLVNACYPAEVSRNEEAYCRELLGSLGIADSVTLVSDYLEDCDSLNWLSLADVIVFPYQQTQESSSAAVRWGLATGKPVFCTPLEIFEDVASAVHFLPGITTKHLSEGLSVWLKGGVDLGALEHRQASWLLQHDWRGLSTRLHNQLIALKLNSF